MTIVPQDVFLFTGSIRENLLCGNGDIPEEQIINACRMANIDKFILSQWAGLETEVGSTGAKLSGGEKQRIAIARALLRRPDLLIFDEATSDLDAESEEMISKAIDKVDWDCSMVIIAHRLSTVVNADIIYVFDGGRVVARGSHEELVEESNLYRDLCGKQLSLQREQISF